MSLKQKQTDLEALERASALIAEWVFNAHETEEADEFISFRDKCVGILEIFEPHVRSYEAEIESLKASISKVVNDGDIEDVLEEVAEPEEAKQAPVATEPPADTYKTKGKMKPDAQQVLDDLMNKVTSKRASKGSYPKATVLEDMHDDLKIQLRSIYVAGQNTLNPDVIEQMSQEFGVSKLRIAEYFGWLQR